MRSDHPSLRPSKYFDGKDHDGNGLADVALLAENGSTAGNELLDNGTRRFLALRIDGEEAKDPARSMYIAYNWAPAAVDITLPATATGKVWRLAAQSDVGLAAASGSEPAVGTATLHMAARSVVVLVER
jgi:glycogen operon protein